MKQLAIKSEQSAGVISARDPVPLYHRIYLVLLQNILDHTFPPSQPMPAEAELCTLMGVSRITLRTALARLEQEGLVHRQRGRGTYPNAGATHGPSGLSTHLRNQASLALRTKVQVLDHSTVTASQSISDALELPKATKVLRIVRLRSDATSPISYSVCHVPHDLAAFLPRRRIGTLPISNLLAAAGLVLDATSERLSASIAGVDVAAALGVDMGGALLSMVRKVRVEDGRMVEHLRVLYRPDRYEYSVEYRGGEANDPSSPWRARMTDSAG